MMAEEARMSSARQSRVTSLQVARRVNRFALYVGVLILCALFAFPFFWTISSSLKSVDELFVFPPLWLPAVPQWVNYKIIWVDFPFKTWILNTVDIVILSTAGTLLSATMVAYSFARFRYRGRDLLFLITLGTMMLPGQVTLIPQYLLFKQVGWLDTIKPLWVPAWFGGGAFNIFLLRQFIMTIPRDLDEAARIDGASYMRTLFSILLPLTMPALATLTVINFIASWNDFMGPMIYLNSADKMTVSVGLRSLSGASGGGSYLVSNDHWLMAACVLALLPCIAVFFAAQKYFVRGIVMSGIKG